MKLAPSAPKFYILFRTPLEPTNSSGKCEFIDRQTTCGMTSSWLWSTPHTTWKNRRIERKICHHHDHDLMLDIQKDEIVIDYLPVELTKGESK